MEVEAFQERWKEESLNFDKEEFYESIQAPKWIDFTLPAPEEPLIDDNAWFCIRAGCDQKHGTLLDQNHSSSLKSQAPKFVSFISKSPTMEGKSSVRPRLRAPLSTPTSKCRDRTPGKAKPPVMSASKLRQKQCEENEDPNSTNIETLNLKMDAVGAEGFSSPKPSSNADGLNSLEENPPHILTGKQIVAASDINLTPQNQSIKATAAFSTPRIKKNHSVKPEPFRSNPALSKGMNTTARSKAVAPRCILFETPTKFVKKTPSKDITPVTKHFANPKKHVQFAANDNKYSSPAKVTPKKCFTTCSLQPSESPLSRAHNFSSSSRPKDSRKVTNHSPSSHRKVLFSEQSNEKESLRRANVQEMDLVQGKIGSTQEDGGWSDNQSSIKQPHTGNDDEQNPLTYVGENSEETNSKEIMRHESGMAEQYAAQPATIISGEGLTYGISEINSHKESESYGAEESTSEQDEANGVQQFFKGLPKDRENKKQNHSDGKVEITILEGGESDDQSKFDVESDDSYIERRDNEAEMNSVAENRVGREMMLIKNRLDSELVFNLQNDSDGKNEIEILKDGKNDGDSILYVKPIDGSLQETENKNDSASESKFTGRNMRVTETSDLKSECDAKLNKRNLEERANKAVMHSAAKNKGSDAKNSIIIWLGSESESNLEIDYDGKAGIATLEDGKHDGQDALDARHNDANQEEKETKVLMNSSSENKRAREEISINFQFASGAKSNLQNDFDGIADISILEDGRNVVQSAFDVERNTHNSLERANTVIKESNAENEGAREDSIKNQLASESECKDKHMEGKATRALKCDTDIESDNIFIKEKVGEVLTISDCINEIAVLETGIEVDSSEPVSQPKHVGKKDDFYLKNKQNSKENEDHVIFDEEHAIRGAKKGKAGEVIQLESDLEFRSNILQKDTNLDSGECLQVTVNVAIKNVKEDNRDSMQKIDTDDSATDNGENTGLSRPNSRCNDSQYFSQDLRDDATIFLKSAIEPESKQCNNLKDATIIDGGLGCDECSDRSSQLLVSDSLSSEVVCQLPRDCDETPQIAELKSNEEIRLPDRDCLRHSKADGVMEVLAVAGCIAHVIPDAICDEHSEMHSEYVKKDILSTPSKGGKRTSGEMNSKINCSNGEVCQDESCCMASSSCQSALPAKVNGTSIPRAFNHKKIKPTLPRPFRLRTAERGERKEAGLNKKTQQFAEENEISPMREKRANKAQGNYSQIDPSKRGKPERPKPHEGKLKSRPRHTETIKAKTLEDKGEEIKSTPEEPLHHRPVIKMPNFWKPPFKPMRSTKKLTTPKEPNFHPMHSKKYCTKGVESPDRAVV